jgi:hypothetical protein
MQDLTIVSFGNTGRVGSGFVAAALEHSRTSRLYLVNRREVEPVPDPRVVHMTMTDFADGYAAAFSEVSERIDLVHWALGGPPSLGQLRNGAALYRQLHVTFPTRAAHYFAERNPDVVVHYASGAMVGEGRSPVFLHEKAVAERSIAAEARALSYRPRVVIPVGKPKPLPDRFAIESERYGRFVLDRHFDLCEGRIEPATAFEHNQMVG